jgi:hypothetical protein
MKKTNWLITQKQIADCDIVGAIINVDAEQLPDLEIPGLHGAVRLRVEGTNSSADLFANNEARKFFQALHLRWPYAGFFLRLKPVTRISTKDEIIDVSVFLALGFCNVKGLTYCETAKGAGLHFDMTQLTTYLNEVAHRAAELAHVTGISKEEIKKRDNLIAASVVSFFDAGRSYLPNQGKDQ